MKAAQLLVQLSGQYRCHQHSKEVECGAALAMGRAYGHACNTGTRGAHTRASRESAVEKPAAHAARAGRAAAAAPARYRRGEAPGSECHLKWSRKWSRFRQKTQDLKRSPL